MTKTKICSFNERDFLEKYNEEILDFVEGTLIDNYITVNDDGKYFVYQECYLNEWSSGYYMYEFDNAKEAFDFWYENVWYDNEDQEGLTA